MQKVSSSLVKVGLKKSFKLLSAGQVASICKQPKSYQQIFQRSEYKSFNNTILQVKALKIWCPTQESNQLLLRQGSDEQTHLESNPNLCPKPSLRPSRIPVNTQNDFTPKKLSKYEVFPKTEVRRQRRQSRSARPLFHICHHPSSAYNSIVLSLPAHHPAQFPVIISQRAEVIITGLRFCVR